MRRLLEYGGYSAGVVLVLLGVAVIVLGVNGRSTVNDQLAKEQIVGTPDMTPDAIRKEAAAANLQNVDAPSCSVAGLPVDSGGRARCFAEYMRIHTLEKTGGQTFAQMPLYIGKDGTPTNDPQQADIGPSGRPLENTARDLWVTETALATALNMSYMATQLALFSVVTGIALLLAGVGFFVLAWGALRNGLQKPGISP
jgi:hypothetical protein